MMLSTVVFLSVSIWLTVLGWYDSYYRRLPNYLTLGGAAVFLMFRFCVHGLSGPLGLWNGLIGGLAGGVFLFLPFLLRGAGAGDIKMLFAVGCYVGYPGIFGVMILSTIFGLILGLVMLCAGKLDGARLKHLWNCCVNIRYDRAAGAADLPPVKSEKVRIPFGVAIGAGCWVLLVIGKVMSGG